jgi:hypothetical protein
MLGISHVQHGVECIAVLSIVCLISPPLVAGGGVDSNYGGEGWEAMDTE